MGNNDEAPSPQNKAYILLERVKKYKENLQNNEVKAPEKCPKCEGIWGYFYCHELKGRIFLVIVEEIVHRIESALQRWKCPGCRKTFTQYPDFAIPYKRYVQQEVTMKSIEYVIEEKKTYRKLTYEGGKKICYGGKCGIEEGMQLSHSSIHRWLGWMGKLEKYVMDILLKLKNAGVSSEIFRKPQNISSKKYRSEERRKVLEICVTLFEANKEYKKMFGKEIFPLKL